MEVVVVSIWYLVFGFVWALTMLLRNIDAIGGLKLTTKYQVPFADYGSNS
jgi:hypothetical protein